MSLCTCVFLPSPGLHRGIPCLSIGKSLHSESPKIMLPMVPDRPPCELIVCCTLLLTFSWPSKYPFHLLLLQLPASVKVKHALSSAVGIGKDLHRPGAKTMAGCSGVLFIALHHQTWGLLLSHHHVPLLYDPQRHFLPSGVRRLSSPLASNQLAVLPGRVRDYKAHFLIQAYSAFPRTHLFS